MNLNQYEISFVIKGILDDPSHCNTQTWERVIELAKQGRDLAETEFHKRNKLWAAKMDTLHTLYGLTPKCLEGEEKS